MNSEVLAAESLPALVSNGNALNTKWKKNIPRA
jgi:hypothetical protein